MALQSIILHYFASGKGCDHVVNKTLLVHVSGTHNVFLNGFNLSGGSVLFEDS